jgi:Peptidase S46
MRRTHVWVALGLALTAGRGAFAVEGKWTPEQVLQHDPKWLAGLGLKLPPGALWNAEGNGLLDAAVKMGGCSAGFVSAEGLLVTNHHCAFGLLQENSTQENDLITGGFLARDRAAELAGEGARVAVPHRFTDVTAEVDAAAAAAGADDLARFRAVERKGNELVAACEKAPSRRCEVAVYDGGVRYLLVESLEFPDVRLVFAPPNAVGDFGGEVDNWSWPRHAGDFALLRVYAGPDHQPAPHAAGNIPYKPPHHFPVSREGVEPGAFVMIPGYPGATFRSLTAAEMRERAELYFPSRAELYRAWIDRMNTASATGDAARIALASRIKSLENVEKNARGQLAGIARGRMLERKEAAEREVLDWAAKWLGERPELHQAVAAQGEIARLAAARRATYGRDFLLSMAHTGAKPLDLALTLVRWAGEKAKPDVEREPAYQERNRERLAERLRLDQKQLHPPTEAVLLADYLDRLAALPESSRVPAVESLLGGAHDRQAVGRKAAELLAGSRVADLAERTKMFDESAAELRARRDPLLDFAFALDRELLAAKERDDRERGTLSRLRPRWRRAVMAHAGKPIAPDANGTLRVSFAHVQGYSPRDGVRMEPQTTVAGILEKQTGKPPFDAPVELRDAASKAPASRFADPRLKDVPVDFLADADTTGGNSGSPVVDGRGRLVGVNFDRVWENVANDFGYLPAVARNVNVDVRYLLWTLETLHGDAARGLLGELGAAP